jgi:predicted MPP superfamily phosphohydrolase
MLGKEQQKEVKYMKLTEYGFRSNRIKRSMSIALISDLHGCDVGEAVKILKKTSPTYILAPGDIFERLDGSCDKVNQNGFVLLRESAKIAPTFYSSGNHEIGGTRSWALGLGLKKPIRAEINEENMEKIKACGVHMLEDSYEIFDGIAFGGLCSGILNAERKPDVSWLDDFCAANAPKIMLCHHPEYYEKYLSGYDIDLIVSGHAHGGQWQFFGRGVFAPGQGLFPKYTSGVYGEKLVVSRGMKKGKLIPRIFNPTEIVLIKIN